MAGIGFELKKLFSKKGLFALIRAYGYAGIVCTGPMLLGMVLLAGVRMIATFAGTAKDMQELLICMITYSLLASLLVTNLLSMITTRYTADMLYMNKDDRIMPSFYGSIALTYVIGGLGYGIFLLFSGIEPMHQLCCFILFMELIVVWQEINYLTAVKDYKGILLTFLMAVVAGLAAGYLLVRAGADPVLSLFGCVIIAYGIMLVWYYRLLIQYFPQGRGTSLAFMEWIDRYPQLMGVGTCIGIGLYIHLILMWASPIGVQIKGLFYSAPGMMFQHFLPFYPY